MSGSTSRNQSQDPDYVGPVGFEKKFHQTHFQGVRTYPTHPKDDPNWEYVGVGKWRKKDVMNNGYLSLEPGRMQITFELPKNLITNDMQESELYKHGWIFQSVKTIPQFEYQNTYQGYAQLLKMWAKQFEEWAKIVEMTEKRIRAGDMPEVTDAIPKQKTTRLDEEKQT